ncbi:MULTISPECIES: endonuclease/exonuclease/phosphatase family protein [unclassified Paludibacterium]|uniref:endonuclease/exonuclease/phosphatase family protein n=1 Tax=unclassified Paludibacterium TaxID=2618429 RepID=UPI001C050E48|nr:endonuclease/exonuclease/phosphatase family protein [Paludibacterium sp. B53371]BEV73093.1 endonuclease/exonuclease/phosphatase family protein [Paludibacterium sp. THUN1379]
MQHGKVDPVLARGLCCLKQRIAAAAIPSSRIDETLNLATWNIREFGQRARSEAAIHYLAEIMGQFDLISLIELKEDLSDLQRVLAILGPDWRVVYSGVVPDPGGNGERFAFVYDRRAVTFNGLAAVAIPPRQRRGREYVLAEGMWWRLPYLASFRSGNFDFVVMAVHIRWGEHEADRLGELSMLAQWLDDFRRSEQSVDEDLIVLGDFNIPSRDSPLFAALTRYGLQVPQAMIGDGFGSNLARDKRYDQILQYPSAVYPDSFADRGGVLDFHLGDAFINELFDPAHFGPMSKARYTRELSDHLPVWIQIRTDNDAAQLQQLIR